MNAQNGTYEKTLRELGSGRKRSHWMWFIFPQYNGLGFSLTSRNYAIKSMAEAREYLMHPLLGARLVACTKTVNQLPGRSARDIFGFPDYLKFHSSMTLFELASGTESEFTFALAKYYNGARDARTIELVCKSGC